MTAEGLDQQELTGIFVAQSVGCIHQHGFDLTLRRKIAQPLKPRAQQRGTAMALALKTHSAGTW
jgi:hypothetical protein